METKTIEITVAISAETAKRIAVIRKYREASALAEKVGIKTEVINKEKFTEVLQQLGAEVIANLKYTYSFDDAVRELTKQEEEQHDE